jgi:glutamate carboxypeptidase
MPKAFVNTAFLKKTLPWFQAVSTSFLEPEGHPIQELDLLRAWVEISSPSNNRSGVEHMQNLVGLQLAELGFACQFLPHPEGKTAPFLKAELPGETDQFITLVCHSDTVLPSDGFTLSDDGVRGSGSGVIDNKGGLVVMISGLRRLLKAQSQLKYSLRVLCSPNEEVGSSGFIPLYLEQAEDTLFALGMEPALSNGSIICQRRGNRWYDIEVSGREAHAGRSRGEHANAAHDLAKKIVALQYLNNLKKEMAVNVGHIQGGQDRYNIVCGHATAKLDVRFSTLEHRDKMHRKINAILNKSHEVSSCGRFRTKTSYKIVDDCPPVAPTRRALKLSQSYIEAIQSLEGRKIGAESAGGAGDVNYLSRKGIVVLDGFGPVGGEMHTRREFVEIKTLGTRSAALAFFLDTIQSW